MKPFTADCYPVKDTQTCRRALQLLLRRYAQGNIHSILASQTQRPHCYTRGVTVITFALVMLCVGLRAQQCTLPSRIFLPTADVVRYEGYGVYMDVDGEYMVAGAPSNDSLQVDAGRAYVYKLGAGDEWMKIAELFPSDPAKSNLFGMGVSIFGSSIAVFAREFNDDGTAHAKIYIYEKPAAGEWTSSSESYIIRNSAGVQRSSFGQFSLHGNELIAVAGIDSKTEIQVYEKVNGVFSLSQSIDGPVDKYGSSNDIWNLAVSDGFFAIGSEQFDNTDGTSGVVFIYERSGGPYASTPAVLKSSLQTSTEWQGFGAGLAVHNSTLTVVGARRASPTYHQTLYVFERPATGWVDTRQPPILEHSGYTFYDFDVTANENYIFITHPNRQAVIGYKRPASGWSPAAEYFEISDLPADLYLVGVQIRLADQHLVLGCPVKYLAKGLGDELIADYYSASNVWEDPGLHYNQIIREVSVNASDDLFGVGMAAHGNFLAITASRDDALGHNTGVVYLYDILKENATPEQKIYPPEEENHTGFGNSLALGDSLMFIAAPFKDSVGTDPRPIFYGIGKVYVYRLTAGGWKYHSQIIAPSIRSETYFGQNVVCSPGYVAVTEFYPGSSESVGLVHIYKENSAGKFVYLATLKPSVQLRSDFFGKSMVMNDSMMVIGTGNGAVNSSYRMRTYVYKKKGEWKNATEDAALINSDAGWSDRFGASVALYGDYIVVGAPRSPGYDPRPIPRSYIIPGAAYIFKRPAGGWHGTIEEIAKLTPSDPVDIGNFGWRVAMDHNDIFISAPYAVDLYNYTNYFTNNDNSLRPGKVYHFRKPEGEWATTNGEHRQIMSFEPEVMDGYGYELFISDRHLYVSAILDDTPSGFRSGSVQTMMQLPVIDPIKVSCSDETDVNLLAFPSRGGQWAGPGIDNITKTFSPSVAGPGLHTLTYTVSGCQETTSAEVIVSEFAVLEKSEPATIKCIGATVPLVFTSNEPQTYYRWYFKEEPGDAFVKIDSMKNTIDVQKPGYYQVSVKRAVCPERTEAFTISEEAGVAIEIEPVTEICADVELKLAADPPSGSWSGRGMSADGIFSTSGLADGSYVQRYEYTTPIGCIWKDSTTITLDRLKEPVLLQDGETICGSSPVKLSLENVDHKSTVAWYDNNADIMKGTSTSFVVTTPGSYSATVSKHSCSFQTRIVTLTAEADSLFVPNLVTSNNDFKNDYFEVRGKGMDKFYLSVINRYGASVFQTTDPTFRWSPDEVSSGTYFWRVTYQNCSSEVRERKGWLHIMR